MTLIYETIHRHGKCAAVLRKRNILCRAEVLAEFMERFVAIQSSNFKRCLVLTVAQIQRDAKPQQTIGKADVPLPESTMLMGVLKSVSPSSLHPVLLKENNMLV